MIWGEFYEEMYGSGWAIFPRIGPWKHYHVLRDTGDNTYGWQPYVETRVRHGEFLLPWTTTDDTSFLRHLISSAKAAAQGGWLYIAYQHSLQEGLGVQRPGKSRHSIAFFLNTSRSWSVGVAYKDDFFRCTPPAFLLETAAIEKPYTPLSAWERL